MGIYGQAGRIQQPQLGQQTRLVPVDVLVGHLPVSYAHDHHQCHLDPPARGGHSGQQVADRLGVGEADHQFIHQPLLILCAGDGDELHIRREELADQLGGIELPYPLHSHASRPGAQVEQVGGIDHGGQGAFQVGMELCLQVNLEQGSRTCHAGSKNLLQR